MRRKISWLGSLILFVALGCQHPLKDKQFVRLFHEDGPPKDWIVRDGADVAKPHAGGGAWRVERGILLGGNASGTWLISPKEYGDFILEFEFKLGERGHAGCGLRVPLGGDPSFEGLRLQMVDPRFFGNEPVQPEESTGSLYRAVPPKKQVFKPLDWNKYEIACEGAWVKVALNGEVILEVNLDEQNKSIKRPNGMDASPLKNRPRRGHIGFLELSSGGSQAQIRNVRIQELD